MLVDAAAHVDVIVDDLVPFIDQPWRREVETRQPFSLFPGTLGVPAAATGDRSESATFDQSGRGEDPAITIEFPPALLLSMAHHPRVALERAIAVGYARWVANVYLPAHPQTRVMLYLPVRDVDACCRLVQEFSSTPGIAGAFVSNLSVRQPFDNHMLPIYSLLEEHRVPLGFRPMLLWTESPHLAVFDTYSAAYAYGHPFVQGAHLINWIISGMPVRFPKLRCIFYGAGVAWLNFVAHRLDQSYMRRPSEAPLLRERPSHYMRQYFYGTHPIETADDCGYLEATFRQIGCDQFLYASNRPEWDAQSPAAIRDLPFLSAVEKEQVLGTNAATLFQLV